MQIYHYILIAVYALFAVLYLISKYKLKFSVSLTFKVITALLFFATSVINTIVFNVSTFSILVNLALLFALVGDILLRFRVHSKKYFVIGACLFLVCQLLIAAIAIVEIGFSFISLIAGVAAIIVCVALKKSYSELIHKILPFIMIYVFFMAFNMTNGIQLIVTGQIGNILLGTGAILLSCSDLILFIDGFVKKTKSFGFLNWLFYFTAAMLMAMSIVFVK